MSRRPQGLADPLPDGIRKDPRHHTKHPLRPTNTIVEAFLESSSEITWRTFRTAYLVLLEGRFGEDRSPFDELAALATDHDVFLGCNCPTRKNPRVDHCHAYLGLQFMKQKYPGPYVCLPAVSDD